MAVTSRPAPPASRLLVIGAMALSTIAQGLYVWAASLTFWPGPGESPTLDDGLLIANTTSIVLMGFSILVGVVARATALAVTMGVWALLLLVNTGLWIVIGLPGMIAVLVLGGVWLARARRTAQPTHH
jgi:hypothetical protein